MKPKILLSCILTIGIAALAVFWLRPTSDDNPVPVASIISDPSLNGDEELPAEIREMVTLLAAAGHSEEAAEEWARRALEMLEDSQPEADPDNLVENLMALSNELDEDFLRQFSGSDAPRASELPGIGDRHPYAYAENLYQTKWEEFVDGLGLSNDEENLVRDLIVAHEAYNTELMDQAGSGQIGWMDYGEARWTMDDLRQKLSPFLSPEHLDALEVNHEQYRDFVRQYRRERLRESEEQGYRSGIVADASDGELDAVMAQVRAGVDVNTSTTNGRWNALARAANNGDVEMARFLIDAGADVNWISSNDRSALRRAAANGHVELVRLLADAGANLEYHPPDRPTATALSDAAFERHTEVVWELLRLGADATGRAGRVALSYAIGDGNREMERMLREAGATR